MVVILIPKRRKMTIFYIKFFFFYNFFIKKIPKRRKMTIFYKKIPKMTIFIYNKYGSKVYFDGSSKIKNILKILTRNQLN